jgi:hypothetical protein
VINNEDTQDELDRRSLAVFKHFAIPHEEAHGRLFTWSGYGATFRMAMLSEDTSWPPLPPQGPRYGWSLRKP